MSQSGRRVPAHETLTVLAQETIYQTDTWWKAVVHYHPENASEFDEVAVYLWLNKDGEWVRKHKYSVSTLKEWTTDKDLVEQYLDAEWDRDTELDAFPVSDYYTVVDGETVFQEDGWWKAVVCVSQKGEYDTQEIMLYLWQHQDGNWVRRQKYVVKSQSDWTTDSDHIERFLQAPDDASPAFDSSQKPPASDSSEAPVKETAVLKPYKKYRQIRKLQSTNEE